MWKYSTVLYSKHFKSALNLCYKRREVTRFFYTFGVVVKTKSKTRASAGISPIIHGEDITNGGIIPIEHNPAKRASIPKTKINGMIFIRYLIFFKSKTLPFVKNLNILDYRKNYNHFFLDCQDFFLKILDNRIKRGIKMLKIKELRLEKEWTQKELAEKLGTNNKNIWAWENKIASPDIETLKQLAEIFDVTVDYLIGRTDEFGATSPKTGATFQGQTAQPNNVATMGATLTEKETELLQAFNALGIFEQDSILVQIKALAEKKQAIKK